MQHAVGAAYAGLGDLDDRLRHQLDVVAAQRGEPAVVEQHPLAEGRVVGQRPGLQVGPPRQLGPQYPKYKIAQCETLKNEKNPIRWLEQKLEIDGSENLEYIRVSLVGDNPADVKAIVDAVREAYFQEVVEKDKLAKSAHKTSVERVLVQFKDTLVTRIGRAGPALAGAAKPAAAGGPVGPAPAANPVGRPDLALDPAAGEVVQASATAPAPSLDQLLANADAFSKPRPGVLAARVSQLELDLPKYETKVTLLKGQVAALKDKLAATPVAEPSAEALAVAERDPEVMGKEYAARRREAEYRSASGVVNNKQADVILRMKAAAAQARADADAARVTKARQLEDARADGKAAVLTRQVEAKEAELVETEAFLAVQRREFEKDKDLLGKLPPELLKDGRRPPPDPADAELGVHYRVFDELNAQLLRLEMELQSPARVRVLQTASAPSPMDGKKQVTATVAACLAGFGLVGFGAVVHEQRAKKVCTLAELRHGTPAPVVGVVPWLPDAADPVKRADIAEAVDKLRATVAQEWLGRGPATVAVTSAVGDEGKAFVAFRLATSLAQAGVRTLLVDFDLRAPSLHEFAGVPNTSGVAEVLRGETDARAGQIVLPTGLAFLPAGQLTPTTDPNPAGLVPTLGAALDPLLYQLRDGVDCVVLHGHPILPAADTVELARRCDVVIVCAMTRDTRVPLVRRATDRVAGMGGPVPAVVYLGATRHEALC